MCVAVQVPTLLWYLVAGIAHTGGIPNPPFTEIAAPDKGPANFSALKFVGPYPGAANSVIRKRGQFLRSYCVGRVRCRVAPSSFFVLLQSTLKDLRG